MKKFWVTLTIVLFTSSLYAQEPVANALKSRLKQPAFNLGLLLKSEAHFSFNDDNFNGGRLFDLGATRVDLRGTVDQNFMYRFQVDLRNQVSVLDAQVGYRFSDQFRIVTGAYKPHTSLDLDPSPGNTHFMKRARQVGIMMNSREIGVTALGESGNLSYRFGMYNGTGLRRQNDGKFLYTARISSKFEVGGGELHAGLNGFWDGSEDNPVGRSGLTSVSGRALYGVFFEYEADRIFTAFEFLQTRFDAVQLGGNEETITGFYGTFGYKLNPKNKVLGRWDYIGYDALNTASDLVILGWNHQATSLISFQVNLQYQLNSNGNDNSGISALMQFQF